MQINNKYTEFYSKITAEYVYPTEFVVRIFLAKYPKLNFEKPKAGDRVLDVGCGDGRNTRFLCEQGFDVSATEISEQIVEFSKSRLLSLGLSAEIKVGRNNNFPFEASSFDYVLAAAVMYYIDEENTLLDNIKEYCRVLKPGGYLIASIANENSYVFEGSELLADGSRKIVNDPYNNRVGYRLHGFKSEKDIEKYFSPFFTDFSFGTASNNYFGIDEKLFYVVCKKK